MNSKKLVISVFVFTTLLFSQGVQANTGVSEILVEIKSAGSSNSLSLDAGLCPEGVTSQKDFREECGDDVRNLTDLEVIFRNFEKETVHVKFELQFLTLSESGTFASALPKKVRTIVLSREDDCEEYACTGPFYSRSVADLLNDREYLSTKKSSEPVLVRLRFIAVKESKAEAELLSVVALDDAEKRTAVSGVGLYPELGLSVNPLGVQWDLSDKSPTDIAPPTPELRFGARYMTRNLFFFRFSGALDFLIPPGTDESEFGDGVRTRLGGGIGLGYAFAGATDIALEVRYLHQFEEGTDMNLVQLVGVTTLDFVRLAK
jgi:hypothetical protein